MRKKPKSTKKDGLSVYDEKKRQITKGNPLTASRKSGKKNATS